MQPQNSDYQVSFPVIFGGPSTGGPNSDGKYTIIPPWNGPCELFVMSVATGGSAGGAAYISQSTLSGSQSSIASTGLAGNGGTPGIYIDGNNPFALTPVWFPIDGPLGMVVASNTTGILVTCVFRRKKSTTQSTHLANVFVPPAPPTDPMTGPQNRTMPQRRSQNGR